MRVLSPAYWLIDQDLAKAWQWQLAAGMMTHVLFCCDSSGANRFNWKLYTEQGAERRRYKTDKIQIKTEPFVHRVRVVKSRRRQKIALSNGWVSWNWIFRRKTFIRRHSATLWANECEAWSHFSLLLPVRLVVPDFTTLLELVYVWASPSCGSRHIPTHTLTLAMCIYKVQL